MPDGGSVTVLGLGPIGDMAARIAQHQGKRVIAVDLVPGATGPGAGPRHRDGRPSTSTSDDLGDVIRDLTDGRGTDSVIDAVGMEAHGSPVARGDAAGHVACCRTRSLHPMAKMARVSTSWPPSTSAIDIVRRGGTVSLIGVYAGAADPLPLNIMFDKQIQFRMGQANVKKWAPEILDTRPRRRRPARTWTSFATHRLPLDDAAHAYEIFQKKQDGAIKIVLQP